MREVLNKRSAAHNLFGRTERKKLVKAQHSIVSDLKRVAISSPFMNMRNIQENAINADDCIGFKLLF